MKFRYMLIFLILITVACSRQKNNVSVSKESQVIVIQGELENGSDLLVTLDLMEPAEFVPIDSIRCDENGKFKFTFNGDGLNFYSLKYTDDGYVTIIAEPGDSIAFKGKASRIYPYEIWGSEASDLVRTLAVYHKEVLDQLHQITVESNELLGEKNYPVRKQILNDRFDSITGAFHNYSRNFIFKYPTSPAILIALYNQFGPGLPVFNPKTDFDIYTFVDSALYTNFPENKAVKSLHSQLTTAIQQLKNQQSKKKLTIGMPAPDFVLNSPEGNKISLAELRGKYVLLQIWATWSKPSEEENRFLKDCNKLFKDKNFAILQVSIDSEEESWINAIDEQYANWYHASDLRRWESAIVDLYRKDLQIEGLDQELITQIEDNLTLAFNKGVKKSQEVAAENMKDILGQLGGGGLPGMDQLPNAA